jgi:uncharacterized membrane protein
MCGTLYRYGLTYTLERIEEATMNWQSRDTSYYKKQNTKKRWATRNVQKKTKGHHNSVNHHFIYGMEDIKNAFLDKTYAKQTQSLTLTSVW